MGEALGLDLFVWHLRPFPFRHLRSTAVRHLRHRNSKVESLLGFSKPRGIMHNQTISSIASFSHGTVLLAIDLPPSAFSLCVLAAQSGKWLCVLVPGPVPAR